MLLLVYVVVCLVHKPNHAMPWLKKCLMQMSRHTTIRIKEAGEREKKIMVSYFKIFDTDKSELVRAVCWSESGVSCLVDSCIFCCCWLVVHFYDFCCCVLLWAARFIWAAQNILMVATIFCLKWRSVHFSFADWS